MAEDLERMEQAMDRLDQASRELLLAAKLEGRTYSELSEELGGSPDAIGMKVKRAETRLAQIYHALEEHGE